MIAAYHLGKKVPSTKSLSKRIEELTAVPATGKTRRTRKSGANSAAAKSSTPRTASRAAAHWTEYEHLAMTQAQASGQDVYHVVVKIDPHCAMPIAGRQLVQNAISMMGPVLAVRPDAKSPAAAKQVEFVVATVQTAEQLAVKCKIPTISGEVTVELLLDAAQAVAQPQNDSAAPVEVSTAETATPEAIPEEVPEGPTAADPVVAPSIQENMLRVDAGRIDSVLNLVGELIIGKSMLQQALNEFS